MIVGIFVLEYYVSLCGLKLLVVSSIEVFCIPLKFGNVLELLIKSSMNVLMKQINYNIQGKWKALKTEE